MLTQIKERLAYAYYDKIRAKGEEITGSRDGDYRFADNEINSVLNGDKELYLLKDLLSDEDFAWLKDEVKRIHGKCFTLNHDIVHLCERVNMEITQGNLSSAQDILEKACEQARVDMIVEMRYGQ